MYRHVYEAFMARSKKEKPAHNTYAYLDGGGSLCFCSTGLLMQMYEESQGRDWLAADPHAEIQDVTVDGTRGWAGISAEDWWKIADANDKDCAPAGEAFIRAGAVMLQLVERREARNG